MGEIDKSEQHFNRVITGLYLITFIFTALSSYANIYEYGFQIFITVMLNEMILLFFTIMAVAEKRKIGKVNSEIKSIMTDASCALYAASAEIEMLRSEIKKLKKERRWTS